MFRSGKQRCISPEGKPFSRLDPLVYLASFIISSLHAASLLVYDCPAQFIGRISKLQREVQLPSFPQFRLNKDGKRVYPPNNVSFPFFSYRRIRIVLPFVVVIRYFVFNPLVARDAIENARERSSLQRLATIRVVMVFIEKKIADKNQF